MAWLDDVKIKLKRKNQILFRKDCEFLEDLASLVEKQNRIQAELLAHGLRDIATVAGEHDALGHAGRVQIADRLRGVVFHHVGDHDMAHVGVVHRHVQDGSR